MSTPIDTYLEELQKYAGSVRVPGLDIASAPVALADIFIDLRMQSEMKETVANPTTRHSSSATSLFQRTPEAPPEAAMRTLIHERRLAILGEPGQGKSTLL